MLIPESLKYDPTDPLEKEDARGAVDGLSDRDVFYYWRFAPAGTMDTEVLIEMRRRLEILKADHHEKYVSISKEIGWG